MRKGWITWILTIAILAMTIGGTTLAWFSAVSEAPVNTFTAGTVEISAGRVVGAGQVINPNWNPGDEDDFELEIINEGTKGIYLRAHVDMEWLPKSYRLFVLYTGQSVQLLAMRWDDVTTMTAPDGPIATGTLRVDYPSDSAYIDGKFSNLSDTAILQNGTFYDVWCMDHWTSINKNTSYNVEIFDPISNPDWYTEVNIQPYWDDIPMSKIAYIINQNYLEEGYSINNIQNAIWHYTNGDAVSGKALEIVEDTEAQHELPTDNIQFTLGEDWILGQDGYYYYETAVLGTYREISEAARTIMFDARVQLNGTLTGNEYQGRTFVMTVFFEAVQSSNGAIDSAWPQHPL